MLDILKSLMGVNQGVNNETALHSSKIESSDLNISKIEFNCEDQGFYSQKLSDLLRGGGCISSMMRRAVGEKYISYSHSAATIAIIDEDSKKNVKLALSDGRAWKLLDLTLLCTDNEQAEAFKEIEKWPKIDAIEQYEKASEYSHDLEMFNNEFLNGLAGLNNSDSRPLNDGGGAGVETRLFQPEVPSSPSLPEDMDLDISNVKIRDDQDFYCFEFSSDLIGGNGGINSIVRRAINKNCISCHNNGFQDNRFQDMVRQGIVVILMRDNSDKSLRIAVGNGSVGRWELLRFASLYDDDKKLGASHIKNVIAESKGWSSINPDGIKQEYERTKSEYPDSLEDFNKKFLERIALLSDPEGVFARKIVARAPASLKEKVAVQDILAENTHVSPSGLPEDMGLDISNVEIRDNQSFYCFEFSPDLVSGENGINSILRRAINKNCIIYPGKNFQDTMKQGVVVIPIRDNSDKSLRIVVGNGSTGRWELLRFAFLYDDDKKLGVSHMVNVITESEKWSGINSDSIRREYERTKSEYPDSLEDFNKKFLERIVLLSDPNSNFARAAFSPGDKPSVAATAAQTSQASDDFIKINDVRSAGLSGSNSNFALNLLPFLDYDSRFLINSSAGDAAKFAVDYVIKHIKNSPIIDMLLGDLTTSKIMMHKKLEEIRLRHGGNYFMITEKNFVPITQEMAAKRIGNCCELSLIAGRAIKEFGSPHKIMVIDVSGRMPDNSISDHQLLRIESEDGNAYYADPLWGLLNKSQKLALTGKDFPTFFPEFSPTGKYNAVDYLYTCARQENRGIINIRPFSEYTKNLQLYKFAEIVKDEDGIVKFQPARAR